MKAFLRLWYIPAIWIIAILCWILLWSHFSAAEDKTYDGGVMYLQKSPMISWATSITFVGDGSGEVTITPDDVKTMTVDELQGLSHLIVIATHVHGDFMFEVGKKLLPRFFKK